MKLAFRSFGTGAKKMVICHGIFGSSDNWLTVSKFFSLEYTVFLVDMRNHGKSAHDAAHDYPSMVMDLYETFFENNWQGAVLMGHSMGGKAVMFFAQAHPELISKLIVVDIAPRFYGVHHDKILQGLNSIPLQSIESRAQADAILAQFVPQLDTRQFLLKNLQRDENAFVWKINLKALTENISNIGITVPEEPMVKLPTLFIRGELSYYIRPEDEALIYTIFPNASVKTVANAGHWVQAEAPQAFAQVVNEFIA